MGRVFVFDLGNVLAIPMDTKMLYNRLECKISYDDFINFFKNDSTVIEAHIGNISDDEHIQKLLKFAKSSKTIEEYKVIYAMAKNGLFQDTVDIIDVLKKDKKKVYLLSNLRKIDFDCFRSIYDVSKFDGLFLSYRMHMNKPDKRIYEKMIQKLKIAPHMINFFDDTMENVKSAQECGINAYCVTGNNIKSVFQKVCKGENNEHE